MSGRGSRVVFVGNIPYDVTEERLTEIFSTAGPVVSFRLLFDRETGKPKGYGFCEYKDADTALSAIRNLNNYDLGGRKLRVAYAENESRDGPASGPAAAAGADMNIPAHPMLTTGIHGNMAFEVNKLLEKMPTQHLYEMMVQMKNLVQQTPDTARQILQNNPQVAYALLQAQVILGFLSPNAAKQLLISQPAAPPVMPSTIPVGVPGAVPMSHGIGQDIHTAGVPPAAPLGGFGATGPYGAPAPPVQPPFAQAGAAYPMPQQPVMGAPAGIPQPQPQIQINPHTGMPVLPPNLIESLPVPPEQRVLIDQVLRLTPQQVEALPPEQRSQVNQLRQFVLSCFMRPNS